MSKRGSERSAGRARLETNSLAMSAPLPPSRGLGEKRQSLSSKDFKQHGIDELKPML